MDIDIHYINQPAMIEITQTQQYEQNRYEKLHHILNWYDFDKESQTNILQAIELVLPKQLGKLENCGNYDECLEQFNKLLQDNFKIDTSSERQHLVDKFDDIVIRKKLNHLLTKYTKAIYDGEDIEHVIILGCSENGFRNRLAFLIKQVQSGAKIKFLYPAGGKRDLWLDHEPIATELVSKRLADLQNITLEKALAIVKEKKQEFFSEIEKLKSNQANIDSVKYQADINRLVKESRIKSVEYFKNMQIDWPTETDMMEEILVKNKDKLPNIKVFPVLNPNASSSNLRGRPETNENYTSFLDKYINDILNVKQIAIVSSQPHVEYQLEVGKTVFWKNNINIELKAFSPGISIDSINYSDVFDSIARTIYSGLSRVNKKALNSNI